MTFYEKVKALCETKGISITTLAIELGFSKSAPTTWKASDGLPRASTIKKVADFLEVPVDYLLGRYSTPDCNINAGDITSSTVISGNNNTLTDKEKLSTQEQDFLRIYRMADGKTQMKIMQFIYTFEK